MASKVTEIASWEAGEKPFIQRAWLFLCSEDLVNPGERVKAFCRVMHYNNSNNHINDCEIADDKIWIIGEGGRRGRWLNAVNEGEVIESLLRQAAEWGGE